MRNLIANIENKFFIASKFFLFSVMSRQYFVYILSNWNHKVIYTGITNNLERRLYEHKNKLMDGFTKKYNLTKLVYYEHTDDVLSAIAREKEIKKWRREKKNKLVESINPQWKDLSKEFEL
jgi:putative endonuclease